MDTVVLVIGVKNSERHNSLMCHRVAAIGQREASRFLNELYNWHSSCFTSVHPARHTTTRDDSQVQSLKTV